MIQRPLFPVPAEWRPTPIAQLPSWADAKRIAIDCETRDEKLTDLGPGVRRGAYIVGVSFAIEDGPAHYVPFRHGAPDDDLSADVALTYLRLEAAKFGGAVVGANLGYDLDFLLQDGIDLSHCKFRDVQVAEPLLDELQNSYSLDNIAARHGLPGKDEKVLQAALQDHGLKPGKADLWKLPARYVGAYAEQDVRLPLQLIRRQERMLEEQDLWSVYELESSLLPVLVRVRRRGVRISFERLEIMEEWCKAQELEVLAEVKRSTGVSVSPDDLWKAEALARVLRAIGVVAPLTPKTGKPSVTKELLASIQHDAAKLLLRARRTNKVRTAYCQSLREYATNGRIHCTFNQLRKVKEDNDGDDEGARYGRLSCADPNLQQSPARDPELGPMYRSIFLPDEGGEWACLDFSQQEPRWLTHYADAVGCRKAGVAAQRYREDPRTDNHQMMADMTGLKRKDAKEIYLGICYGMGGAKLCHKLGLPTEWIWSQARNKMVEVAGPEGQQILDKFDREAPYVRQLAEKCREKVERTGVIRTAGGRLCHFPKRDDGAFDWAHKAINRLIQGVSGDQTKKSMVDADAAGIPLQLQVHDELDLSVSDRRVAFQLAEIMQTSMKASVPFLVDAEFGPSWGEIKSA